MCSAYFQISIKMGNQTENEWKMCVCVCVMWFKLKLKEI